MSAQQSLPAAPAKSASLLSLWIHLLCIFHIDRIIQYVAFCAGLLSLSLLFWRFIPIAYVSTSFLFWLDDIPPCGWATTWLSIHPWMVVWVVYTFWHLQTVLLGKCVYLYSSESLFSIIWGTGMLFSPFPHSQS